MNKLRPLLSIVAVLLVIILAGTSKVHAQLLEADTVQQVEASVKVHSPHKATMYSVILPGLGQAYNKKYWKLPILYAGVGALGYAIHFNTKYYKKYKSAYRDWIINDPYSKSYLEFIPPNSKIDLLFFFLFFPSPSFVHD